MTPISTVPPVLHAAAAATSGGSAVTQWAARHGFTALGVATVLVGMTALVWGLIGRVRGKSDPQIGLYVMVIVIGLITPNAGSSLTHVLGRMQGTATASATSTPATTSTAAVTPSPAPSSSTGGADEGVLVWAVAALAVVLALAVAYWLAARVRRDARAALDRRSRAREARARQEAQWQAWADRHRDLNQRVLDTETDWDTMFYKPALTDMGVPVVADAWEAWRALGTVDPAVPRHVPQEDDVADYPYPRAVAAACAAWEAADQYAARVGQDLLPEEERRTLRRVRDLLSQAENEASSVNERALAYQQVERLLGTLRHVTPPPRAVAQLEDSRTRLRTLPPALHQQGARQTMTTTEENQP